MLLVWTRLVEVRTVGRWQVSNPWKKYGVKIPKWYGIAGLWIGSRVQPKKCQAKRSFSQGPQQP